MYINQEDEIKELLRKEDSAKHYMLFSFMFGVFTLATFKDLISSGFESASIIIRMALIIGFVLLTIYFYLQADGMLENEEKDKIDNYRESLEKGQAEAGLKEQAVDKYYTKSSLQSFKKLIYILWTAIFILFMALSIISFAIKPVEEPVDTKAKTTTTSGAKTITPATTTKPATVK